MKLTIPRNDLWRGIDTVLDVVPNKPAMPVLGNLQLTAENGRLSLAATDLDGFPGDELILGVPDATVAAAFQTISAHDLLEPNEPVDSDVIVCSDSREARRLVMDLAEMINGIRAVDGGGLENAAYVEGFTALLLNINRVYKARSAIRITGI